MDELMIEKLVLKGETETQKEAIKVYRKMHEKMSGAEFGEFVLSIMEMVLGRTDLKDMINAGPIPLSSYSAINGSDKNMDAPDNYRYLSELTQNLKWLSKLEKLDEIAENLKELKQIYNNKAEIEPAESGRDNINIASYIIGDHVENNENGTGRTDGTPGEHAEKKHDFANWENRASDNSDGKDINDINKFKGVDINKIRNINKKFSSV